MRDRLLSIASRAYMLASREPRITVVALHRVGPLAAIQPVHVERCFRFLAAHFRLAHPSEIDLVKQERRVAVVTIDDGHADAYQHIFPIAKALRVPLSLCIPTDFFFRRRWLWFDEILWAMHNARPTAATVNGMEVNTRDPSSFRNVLQHLKYCPPAMREKIICDVLGALDLSLPAVPPEEYRALTVPELQEMLASGVVEIVGHTVTHTIASVLSGESLEAELRESKHEWESFLGRSLVSFCYPNGERGDFNERTAKPIEKAGYLYAFTSLEGTNLVRAMNPLEVKRVHVQAKPGVCAKLLSGLVDLQNSLRTRRFDEAGGTEPSHH